MSNTTTTTTNLATHELLELRELMSTEIIGIKKTQASMSMVKDEELKSFMEKCLNSKKGNLESMQQFINKANLK